MSSNVKTKNPLEENKIDHALNYLNSKVKGQSDIIRYCLTAFLADGHVLIESVPGLGKTSIAKGLSEVFSGQFSRVQMTSDLMPSDIIGYFKPTGQGFQLEFQKGPLFTNILLADELNRTTPKTQSALLEAMAEYQVTIDGKTEYLNKPFFVIATQNPSYSHGVFPLTESELDRFMFKMIMNYPHESDEALIYQNFLTNGKGDNTQSFEPLTQQDILEYKSRIKDVFIHSDVLKYIQKIIIGTRKNPQIQAGASIRAGLLFIQALKSYAFILKKEYVTPEIVRELAPLLLAHRLVLIGHEINHENSLEIIKNIIDETPTPQ